MNIVILDAHTANPGDLRWDDLGVLGRLSVYERTDPQFVVERARDADVVLTNKTVLGRAELEALPRLRYVGLLSTGANVVDLDAARERGLAVTNVPAYATEEVAQATFALLLELTNHVGHYNTAVHGGRWTSSPDFCFVDDTHRPVSLREKTMGIVGPGAIGTAVARMALAFGMHVVAFARTPRTLSGVRFVSLEELLRRSDVVSLHCPLTDQTHHLIGKSALELMQPTALLLNTSRGALVDAERLAAALNAGRIAGAGLDTLDAEPPPAGHPLLHARNCIITPHIAWAAREARERLLHEVLENLRAFREGKARNRIV